MRVKRMRIFLVLSFLFSMVFCADKAPSKIDISLQKEVEIPLIKDDIFILYTDGFTEAMNKNHEEYGTERLLTLITHHAGSSAAELRNLIFKDVTQFRGKAIQHDDMTIVIVKVK